MLAGRFRDDANRSRMRAIRIATRRRRRLRVTNVGRGTNTVHLQYTRGFGTSTAQMSDDQRRARNAGSSSRTVERKWRLRRARERQLQLIGALKRRLKARCLTRVQAISGSRSDICALLICSSALRARTRAAVLQEWAIIDWVYRSWRGASAHRHREEKALRMANGDYPPSKQLVNTKYFRSAQLSRSARAESTTEPSTRRKLLLHCTRTSIKLRGRAT